ncbi:MAG: hypothetical protein ACE5D3_01555 [Candidatus Binatia bacterium]
MSRCPGCNKEDFRVRVGIDDQGDVEETVCADDDCGYILKRERIVERPDGTKQRRPQRVAPDEQPEGLSPMKGRGPISLEEEIPSAEEMMRLAVQMREETVGKAARDIVRGALKEAAEPNVILKGNYEFLVSEEDGVPAVVLKEVVRNLRERGYKPTRRAEPGVGTWIQIKWPTTAKSKRKKSKAPVQPKDSQEISFKKKTSGPQVESPKAATQQRAAAKHRQKALKARSDLPK